MQLLQGLFFSLSPARATLVGLICIGSMVTALGVLAQEKLAVAPMPLAAASKPDPKPLWKDLAPAQQQALSPLEPHWNALNEPQKRKWLTLSLNFAKMSPAEQTNLHERMLDWGKLSPVQRNQARLNFSETKRLAPTEKQAKWEAYQTLDPEEKEKLAHSAPRKLPGAAIASKLVPTQKLAMVPPPKDDLKGPSIAAQPHQIDAKTLLPLAPLHISRHGIAAPDPAHPAKPAVQ